ncbi:MAG: hypothetical protein EAZ57_04980 [Cytophagales bacterium]|nr:MAG: hypothetical protein EAZ67_00900 [Cytophagales bacterium]TAF61146.1 MAG: hypothetical protein EAZ57_04980 [Cytophagales bacterium]
MHKNYVLWALSLCFLIYLSGCREKNEETIPANFGESYYPLQVGARISYSVKQQIYEASNPNPNIPRLFTYQLREEVLDKSKGENGEDLFRIVRYTRPTGLDNWQIDSVWTVKKDNSQIIKTEHNVPYVKMSFPLYEDKSWNGNAFNSRKRQPYRVVSLGKPFAVNNLNFSRAAVIMHQADSNILFKDVGYEVFADSIGMIYKRHEYLKYCDQDPCVGSKEIVSGSIISEISIFEYKK